MATTPEPEPAESTKEQVLVLHQENTEETEEQGEPDQFYKVSEAQDKLIG